MSLDLAQRIRCLVGRHRRSRSQAVDDGTGLRSRCRGCGRAMVKDYGTWRVASE